MSNQSAARAFDALGDPMRREIVSRLSSGAVPVGEIAASLPIGRPAVSKHLRVLTTAGLVTHTSRGTRNLYALAPEGQREIQHWLVAMWDASLASFARYVDETQLDKSQGENREQTK